MYCGGRVHVHWQKKYMLGKILIRFLDDLDIC